MGSSASIEGSQLEMMITLSEEHDNYNVTKASSHQGRQQQDTRSKILRKALRNKNISDGILRRDGIKESPPLRVEVHGRKAVEAKISALGFEPGIIRLDEGNAITWEWRDSEVPLSVVEGSYDLKECKLVQYKSR
ncbi:hypothetical protein HELRODRAFT_182343 [Helobdella robusta]|uniref:Uncharacterized protein n=1 Tax=Helobdella robusta TaxID=6412 RepID=T1FI33_HELRO|nr:hypothetical protein HELRODRAFT_182343 [Helobdella robusta]ESN90998.1 hypothetical protein HELRODRAFT_182343 [Helobdella robusta]